MARKTALDLLDRLTAAGKSTFSTAEAVEILGRSPQSTVNLLGRLIDDGLIGRVSRGHYAIRPLGRLGTSAAAEDTALAVAAVFSDRPHRIECRCGPDDACSGIYPFPGIRLARVCRNRCLRDVHSLK